MWWINNLTSLRSPGQVNHHHLIRPEVALRRVFLFFSPMSSTSTSQCTSVRSSEEALTDNNLLAASPVPASKEDQNAPGETASSPHDQPAVAVSRTRFLLIMLCIWLGNFTAYFNETTVTTAMHIIGAEFGDSKNQNWIATAYLLGFTVTQTLLGKFSDIFGRAQVFNGTMFIFAIGTLWCAFAQVSPYFSSRFVCWCPDFT